MRVLVLSFLVLLTASLLPADEILPDGVGDDDDEGGGGGGGGGAGGGGGGGVKEEEGAREPREERKRRVEEEAKRKRKQARVSAGDDERMSFFCIRIPPVLDRPCPAGPPPRRPGRGPGRRRRRHRPRAQVEVHRPEALQGLPESALRAAAPGPAQIPPAAAGAPLGGHQAPAGAGPGALRTDGL